MTNEEAKEFLITISYKLGNMSIEYLTEKDGEKMREAIKAIEQQTCEDAVSREAVLGLFAQNADAVRPYSKTWEEVKALPSVNPQPKTGWIPVSERLPEEGESVLTQAMFKDDMKMCVSSRIDWNYWTGWGTRNINIIAWMPLPEPYEPQESEEV